MISYCKGILFVRMLWIIWFCKMLFSRNSFSILTCHVIFEIDTDISKILSNHVSNIFQCHIPSNIFAYNSCTLCMVIDNAFFSGKEHSLKHIYNFYLIEHFYLQEIWKTQHGNKFMIFTSSAKSQKLLKTWAINFQSQTRHMHTLPILLKSKKDKCNTIDA